MAMTPDHVVIPVTLDVTVDLHQKGTNFEDVGEFHHKFDLPSVTHDGVAPHLLDEELYEFRWKFMQEELEEFYIANRDGDLPGAFDALLDLAYVVLGTAHLMGCPWQEGWDLVQAANMAKERATSASQSKRLSAFDVVKPEGWTAPAIEGLIESYGVVSPPSITPLPVEENPWDKVEVHSPTFKIRRDGEE